MKMRWLVYFTIIILADQLSKHWAVGAGLVTFNTGISFGLLSGVLDSSILLGLFLGVLVLGAAVAGRSIWRNHQLAAAFFFGGAVSNLIDRFFYGGVRDFLPVPFLEVSNNLADWAIVIGLVIVGLQASDTIQS